MRSFRTFVASSLLLLALCMPSFAQQQQPSITLNDGMVNIPPSACPGAASGNAVATTGVTAVGTGLTTIGANLTTVFQVSTSAVGTNTHTYVCTMDLPSRTNTGKGVTGIFHFNFYYGIQTNAEASMATPVCGTITLPNPSTAETASTVAPVAVAVTPFPAVASANLGTTTAGAFFTQAVFFTTPPALNGQNQKLVCTFTFNNTATTASVTNTLGGTLYYQSSN